jgi:RNA polymerase sigma factor (sigma-70 family)
MSRKFQTPKNQRESYRYYDADGKKLLELVPGENGVTEAFIATLHNFDDDEWRQQHEDTRNDLKCHSAPNASFEELEENASWIGGTYDDPQATAESSERFKYIKKALDKLPEKQRDAFIAVKCQGYKQKEWANLQGTTESNVALLIKNARKNLKKILFESLFDRAD